LRLLNELRACSYLYSHEQARACGNMVTIQAQSAYSLGIFKTLTVISKESSLLQSVNRLINYFGQGRKNFLPVAICRGE
jgi:hypothetical protein